MKIYNGSGRDLVAQGKEIDPGAIVEVSEEAAKELLEVSGVVEVVEKAEKPKRGRKAKK